jgi:hypothetical protein
MVGSQPVERRIRAELTRCDRRREHQVTPRAPATNILIDAETFNVARLTRMKDLMAGRSCIVNNWLYKRRGSLLRRGFLAARHSVLSDLPISMPALRRPSDVAS